MTRRARLKPLALKATQMSLARRETPKPFHAPLHVVRDEEPSPPRFTELDLFAAGATRADLSDPANAHLAEMLSRG